MDDRGRGRIATLLYVTSIPVFCVLYCTHIVPWWVDRSGVCAIPRRPTDAVEYVWSVWTSNGCTWTSDQARWVLPAIFAGTIIMQVLMIALWRDWDSGPPDWAIELSAFGTGGYLGAAAGFLAWLLSKNLLSAITGLRPGYLPPSYEPAPTVIQGIGIVAWIIVPPIVGIVAGIWVWVQGFRAVRAGFRRLIASTASTPLAIMGTTVGTTVGVPVAVSVALFLVVLAFGVLFLFAAIEIMMFSAGAMVLMGAARALK